MPRTVKTAKRSRREPLFKTSDFCNYLAEKSAQIAPADVESALAQSDAAMQKAIDASTHPLLHRQLDVALRLLADHEAGACPQIPYQTVALLTVASLYLLDPLDVIPDVLGSIGTSDDALVFELAFEMGAAGVERYCTWKDIPLDGLFARRKRRPARRRA